jgi:hypothetical protein
MRITKAMIVAAQRAEFDVNQRMRTLDASRFVPSPPEVIRAMLERRWVRRRPPVAR